MDYLITSFPESLQLVLNNNNKRFEVGHYQIILDNILNEQFGVFVTKRKDSQHSTVGSVQHNSGDLSLRLIRWFNQYDYYFRWEICYFVISTSVKINAANPGTAKWWPYVLNPFGQCSLCFWTWTFYFYHDRIRKSWNAKNFIRRQHVRLIGRQWCEIPYK